MGEVINSNSNLQHGVKHHNNSNVNISRKWHGKSSKVQLTVLPDEKLGPNPVFSTEALLSQEARVQDITSTLAPHPDCILPLLLKKHPTSLKGKQQPDIDCFFPPFLIKIV